jgi:hypothetical protein
MKIKCMTLGSHSSNYVCSYCNKNVSSQDNKYCAKNIISTTYYTIIPSYEDIKKSFLNFFDQPYYNKIE